MNKKPRILKKTGFFYMQKNTAPEKRGIYI